MVNHFNILPWRIHGQRSLVGYGSMGSQRVRQNWVTEHARLYIGCYHPSVVFPLLSLPSAISGHFRMAVCWQINKDKTSAPWKSLAWGARRGMWCSTGFHGNQFNQGANLLFIPTVTGRLPTPPSDECCSCCLLPVPCYPQWVSLQDPFTPDMEITPSIKPLGSLSTLGSFFGLKSR